MEQPKAKRKRVQDVPGQNKKLKVTKNGGLRPALTGGSALKFLSAQPLRMNLHLTVFGIQELGQLVVRTPNTRSPSAADNHATPLKNMNQERSE